MEVLYLLQDEAGQAALKELLCYFRGVPLSKGMRVESRVKNLNFLNVVGSDSN
jgi:hypothetical protein